MNRTWIIILVVVGIGLAVLIGVLATRGKETQAEAQQNLCSSLGSLDTATTNLTSLDPKTASKSDYQSAVSDVQNQWNEVKEDAGNLHNINQSTLQSAWNSFTQSVQSVPGDASVSSALQTVSQSAKTLVTTVQSTAKSLNCSTTTTS
jgi:LPS O-antigen subunit length determinant protein (WzzB/FepE family)